MSPIDIAYRDLGFDRVAAFLNHTPKAICNEVLNAAAAANDWDTLELVLPYSVPKHRQSLLKRASKI